MHSWYYGEHTRTSIGNHGRELCKNEPPDDLQPTKAICFVLLWFVRRVFEQIVDETERTTSE